MALAPALVTALQKLESDALADLGSLLVPALFAEIEAVSPAGAQSVEAIVFTAIQPAVQAALAALLAKIPVVK